MDGEYKPLPPHHHPPTHAVRQVCIDILRAQVFLRVSINRLRNVEGIDRV